MIPLEFLTSVLQQGAPTAAVEAGVTEQWLDPSGAKVWRFILSHWRKYQKMPGLQAVQRECPDFLPAKSQEPLPYHIDQLRESYQRRALQEAATAVVMEGDSPRPLGSVIADVTHKMMALQRIGAHVSDHDLGSERERRARYESYQRVKKGGGLRGLATPWPELDAELLGFQPQHLVTVAARPGVGKCVAAGTLIPDPVDGCFRPVEEVVAQQRPVLTFSKEDGVHATVPAAWIDTGKKSCLRIRTRMGREIVVTPEHPMLRAEGWTRADDLKIGDWITAVAKYPEPLKPVRMQPDWLVALASLLSEGSLSGHHVSFATADRAYLKFVSAAFRRLGFRVADRGRYSYAVTAYARGDSAKTKNFGGFAGVRQFLKSLGMTGNEVAKVKRIPPAVFSLPNDQLAEFLRVFWWGDGGKDGQIGLASEGMIDDLRRLLLRFGVVCSKAYKRAICNGKEYDSWRLYPQKWCSKALIQLLGTIPGAKGRALRQRTSCEDSETNVVPISDSLSREIKASSLDYWKSEGSGMLADVARNLGRGDPRQVGLRDFTRKHGKPRCGKRLFGALLEVAGNRLSAHRWLLREDIHFDEVVSIEDAGMQRVFDLSVADTHCFVAEDLIAHNTWWLCLTAHHVARVLGKSVLVISKEMSEEEIGRRLDSIHLKIDSRALRRGQLTKPQEKSYFEYLQSKKSLKGRLLVTTDDGTGEKSGTLLIRAKLEVWQPDILFVDGAYLLRNRPDANKTADLYDVSQDMKRIAREFKIPVVATLQMGRPGNEKESKQGGSLAKLQWADAWGQDSDEVMELHQTPSMKVDKRMQVRVLKQREGELLQLEHHWDFTRMNFSVASALGGDDMHANDRETL